MVEPVSGQSQQRCLQRVLGFPVVRDQQTGVSREAQQLGRVWRMRRSMSVDARRELERLITDGHYAETVLSGVRIRIGLVAVDVDQARAFCLFVRERGSHLLAGRRSCQV